MEIINSSKSLETAISKMVRLIIMPLLLKLKLPHPTSQQMIRNLGKKTRLSRKTSSHLARKVTLPSLSLPR